MSKKDEFKQFVSKHPALVEVVKKKNHTWQDLFEVYDLYGDDESMWDRYLKNDESQTGNGTMASKISSLGELTKLFKNVNIENVQKYIDTAQKAIGVIQELTGSGSADIVTKGPSSARPINKIFED